MSKQFICVPATSTPSERAFSGGRLICHYTRGSLSPQALTALMCSNSWIIPQVPTDCADGLTYVVPRVLAGLESAIVVVLRTIILVDGGLFCLETIGTSIIGHTDGFLRKRPVKGGMLGPKLALLGSWNQKGKPKKDKTWKRVTIKKGFVFRCFLSWFGERNCGCPPSSWPRLWRT